MPENADRHAHLVGHLAAGDRVAELPVDCDWSGWADIRVDHPDIGPCATCRGPCIRYGPQGSPLCLDCLDALRKLARNGREVGGA